MNSSDHAPVSGIQLVADYQSVYLTLTMVETAQYEAERSENELLQQLNVAGANGLLNPGDIPREAQSNIVRDSVSAHVKKVQAQQLQGLQVSHVSQLLQEDQTAYKGKKVTVTAFDTGTESIESLWFDPATGYKNNPIKRKQISGIIDEVLLDRNILLLKTNRRTRFINPNLHGFIVYVINPYTMQPSVEINLA